MSFNKIWASALAMAVLVTGCGGGDLAEKNDLGKFGLDRPVRSITVSVMDSATAVSSYVAEFNKRGQLTSFRLFLKGGALQYGERYKYSSDGSKATMISYDSNNEDTGRFEYEFDGRFTRKYTAYNMNSQEVQRWENENDGVHVTESRFYNECDLATITVNKYDGNAFTQVLLDSNRDTIGVGKGEETPSGKIKSARSEGLQFDIEYDDKDLPVSSFNILVNTYDGLEYNLRAEGCTVRYEYEFDEKGNWVSRTSYIEGVSVPEECIVREIEYF